MRIPSTTNAGPPIYDGTSYLPWSRSMISHLRSQGHLCAILDPSTFLSALSNQYTPSENSAARNTILFHLSPNQKSRYLHLTSASEIWSAIKEDYKTTLCPDTIRQALYDTTLLYCNRNIDFYIQKVTSRVEEYNFVSEGHKISKQEHVFILLRGLMTTGNTDKRGWRAFCEAVKHRVREQPKILVALMLEHDRRCRMRGGRWIS
ncbi:hypothetical protein BZA77DRAFT_360985 [Pyronema omphalodes]|nr:hypothetical protein BZA77DRAFT_362817 [Pyronema omphalodes]KAI5810604.1 hypothetical protein BZA77DRAFT_360985 [Pyronema omphalodes]